MERLSKTRWLDHGLLSLATAGFTALKADKLAKSFGVSRGSFYWHFDNLADFHHQVLTHWQTLAVSNAVEMLNEQMQSPQEKLKQVIQMGVSAERSLEQAIRAWSFNSELVQAKVAEVDGQRLEFLEGCLLEMGFSTETAFARSRLIYCGYLGQLMLREPLSEQQQTQIMTELFKLTDA